MRLQNASTNNGSLFWSIVGIVVCVVVAAWSMYDKKDFSTIVANIGSVASLFGLVVAIIQIRSLRHTAEEIQSSVEATKTSLIRSVSLAEVSKAVLLIQLVQGFNRRKEYLAAHLRLQDLRSLLLQFENESRIPVKDRQKYKDSLAKINLHVINLYNASLPKAKDIDVTLINDTLEDVTNILVGLEKSLKFEGGTHAC